MNPYGWSPSDQDLEEARANQEIAAIPPEGTVTHYSASSSLAKTDGHTITVPLPQTLQATRCLGIAAEALELFINKNAGYGEPEADDLAALGQLADMHRKWKRIRRHLETGEPWPMEGEGFNEVCMDMIGHLLLTVDFVTEDK